MMVAPGRSRTDEALKLPRAIDSMMATGSLSSEGMSTWHSGSPNRTLNSTTLGPCAVTMMPT